MRVSASLSEDPVSTGPGRAVSVLAVVTVCLLVTDIKIIPVKSVWTVVSISLTGKSVGLAPTSVPNSAE